MLSEDLAATSDPTDVLAGVGPATKLLSAYTRRGPNTEALKSALYKPMSLVLARKNLDLEIEPTRVYATVLEELRFKSDSDLTADVTPQQVLRRGLAWLDGREGMATRYGATDA